MFKRRQETAYSFPPLTAERLYQNAHRINSTVTHRNRVIDAVEPVLDGKCYRLHFTNGQEAVVAHNQVLDRIIGHDG